MLLGWEETVTCNRLFPGATFEIETYGTSPAYRWLTDFGVFAGTSVVDQLLLLRNLDGNLAVVPCYQTAPVRGDNPNAPVVVGSYTGSAGYTMFHTSLTSITDQFLIRFGVALKNSAGTALGRATGAMTTAVRQCGGALGSGAALVNPGQVTTSDINYQAVGEFRPGAGLDKVMGAFVVTDNEVSHLEYQLVIRTAKDPRAPNSWVTTEAGWTNPSSANSERNTGLLSIPAGANLTSNMFYQLGIAFRKKSGAAGNPRARIDVALAATYA